MTIQMQIHDGISVKTRTYRNVAKGKNYAQMVEGFYAQRDGNKWGELVQLKGKTKILWHFFGNR